MWNRWWLPFKLPTYNVIANTLRKDTKIDDNAPSFRWKVLSWWSTACQQTAVNFWIKYMHSLLLDCHQIAVNCQSTTYASSLHVNCQQTAVDCQHTKYTSSLLVNCQQTTVNCQQIKYMCSLLVNCQHCCHLILYNSYMYCKKIHTLTLKIRDCQYLARNH